MRYRSGVRLVRVDRLVVFSVPDLWRRAGAPLSMERLAWMIAARMFAGRPRLGDSRTPRRGDPATGRRRRTFLGGLPFTERAPWFAARRRAPGVLAHRMGPPVARRPPRQTPVTVRDVGPASRRLAARSDHQLHGLHFLPWCSGVLRDSPRDTSAMRRLARPYETAIPVSAS